MVESTAYFEHFELNHNPFSQEPDTRVFYQGAGHPAVLHALLNDIHNGRPLTKLTGREGVGKTLLSILLAEKLPAEIFEIILLDHPTGSYEDLLRVICRAFDKGMKENGGTIQYHRVFRDLLQRKKEQQKKVLLIIDEAEKIFLATLERLIKTICDTEEAEVLQILLIGSLDLDNNLEQLKIYCSNVDIHAGYSIAPLDEAQTDEYIHYRLQTAGMPAANRAAVFGDEAVSAIYQAAGGNIRRTNSFAEKGLKEAWAMGADSVDPEWIIPRQYLRQDEQSMLAAISGMFVRNKWWAAFGAIVLLLLVITIFSDTSEEDQVTTLEEPVPLEEMVIEKPEIVMPDNTEPSRIALPKEKAESVIKKAREIERSPESKRVSGAESSKKPEKAVPMEKRSRTAVSEKKETAPAEKQSIAAPQEAEKKQPDRVQPPEAGKQVEPARSEIIVVKAQNKKKKIQPGAQDVREKKQEKSVTADASELFEERLRDTSNWLAWSYRGGYTVQLMMLTAEDAEENLKNIIVQEEYAPIRDDMYIIKRNAPPAYFVYYGMYDTMDQARQARNNLPPIVRVHHPYALSIKEALSKTKE